MYLLSVLSHINPIINAIKGNDNINPPVGPNIICIHPENCANTGNPIAPNEIYINSEIKPFLLPSIIPAKETAKVCIVSGTPPGNGIAICASIAVIEANNEHITKSLVFMCILLNISINT